MTQALCCAVPVCRFRDAVHRGKPLQPKVGCSIGHLLGMSLVPGILADLAARLWSRVNEVMHS